MAQRHYSSYLSNLDRQSNHDSPFRNSTPTGRIRQTSPYTRKDNINTTNVSLGSSYKSSYLRRETREPSTNTPTPSRPYSREKATIGLSPAKQSKPIASSDATIVTTLLDDAINNALETSTLVGGRVNGYRNSPSPSPTGSLPRPQNNFRNDSRGRDYTPPSASYKNSTAGTRDMDNRSMYHDQHRNTRPLREFIPAPARPVSPLDDRTISNYSRDFSSPRDREPRPSDNYSPHGHGSRHQRDLSTSNPHSGRAAGSHASPFPYRTRDDDRDGPNRVTPDRRHLSSFDGSRDNYNDRRRDSFDDRRRDSYDDRRKNTSDEMRRGRYDDRRRDDFDGTRRDNYDDRNRGDYADTKRDNYNDRRRDNFDEPRRGIYDDKRRDSYDDTRRDNYNDRRRDSYDDTRRDDFRRTNGDFDAGRRNESAHQNDFKYGGSLDDNISHTRGYSRQVPDSVSLTKYDTTPDRPNSGGTNTSDITGKDTVMSFDIVNEGGNLVVKPRENSPMVTTTHTSQNVATGSIGINHQSGQTQDQQRIVINVQSNPTSLPDSAVGLQSIDNNANRNGLPPRNPAAAVASKVGASDATNSLSDVSSITGFPKSPYTGTGPTSVVSDAKSTVSRWKNKDVFLLPKGKTRSEAAIAAAAAASIIVNDDESNASFEKAVKSVSNMLVSNEQGNDDAATIVRPSVSYGDYKNFSNSDAIVPISFTQVKANMRESLRGRTLENGERSNGARDSNAEAQFFARCAVLAATAIMKADPSDKAVIAQTAAETILSFHHTTQRQDDWINSAERDLREVAGEVSNAIIALPVENNQAMASLASIVVLSEGGKNLAIERIRQRALPQPTIEIIEAKEEERTKDYNFGESIEEEESVPLYENNKESVDDISPVHQLGSLLDRDDSESTDGSKEDMAPQRLSTKPNHNTTYSLNHSTAKMRESDPQHVKSAVRKLLASSSDEDANHNSTRMSPTAAKRSKLDKKQDEIAKRVQRIQMRAAGKSDTEIDEILGVKQAFSNDNLLSGMPPKNRGGNNSRVMNNDSVRQLESEMMSVKEIMNGIGTMLNPVVSYIGKMDVPKLLPALPQCQMNEEDYKFEEFDDIQVNGNQAPDPDNSLVMSDDPHNVQNVQNKDNKKKGPSIPKNGKTKSKSDLVIPSRSNDNNSYPTSIQGVMNNSVTSVLSDDRDENWSRPLENQSSESPIPALDIFSKAPSNDGTQLPFPYPPTDGRKSSGAPSPSPPKRRGASNSSINGSPRRQERQRYSPGPGFSRTFSGDSGAFSAALEKGEFIPIQKLSLSPPAKSTNSLSYSGGATESYVRDNVNGTGNSSLNNGDGHKSPHSSVGGRGNSDKEDTTPVNMERKNDAQVPIGNDEEGGLAAAKEINDTKKKLSAKKIKKKLRKLMKANKNEPK